MQSQNSECAVVHELQPDRTKTRQDESIGKRRVGVGESAKMGKRKERPRLAMEDLGNGKR